MVFTKLSQEQIEKIRTSFDKYDKLGVGNVNLFEIVYIMNELGQVVTYGDVLNLWQLALQKKGEKNKKPVSGLSTDVDGSKAQVGFHTFLQMLSAHFKIQSEKADDSELVNVFIALGGNTNKTGTVSHEKLSDLIKRFELTIGLQGLVKLLENDGKGNITYNSLANFLAH